MQRQHVFAGPYLDRTTHLRDDPACIEAAIADARSRAVPVWNARSLVTAGDPPRAALLDLASLPQAQRNADQLILLGQYAGAPCFACALDAEQAPQLMPEAT